MSTPTSPAVGIRARLVAVLLLAVGLLSPTALTAAAAPAPVATQIRVTALGTPSIETPDTSGAPAAFIVRDVDFALSVTLYGPDGVTPLAASSNKATTLALSVAAGPDALDPTSTLTAVVPAGQSGATFAAVRFTQASNQVRLTVSPTQGTKDALAMTPGTSAPFDVVKTFQTAPSTTTLVGIGSGGGPGQPCTATPEEPVCADLLLPDSAGVDSGVLMSLGACDPTYAGCPAERSVVQTLVALDSTVYTRTSPATLVMKCDKSSCAGGGISSYQLTVSLAPEGPLSPAQPCSVKGQIDPGLDYCVDYVQSTRDNAGDTLLYLLFLRDKRATFP